MPHDGPSSALLEAVAALKHDLGKYVAWRSANLDEAAWGLPVRDDVVEALRADLLHTRGTAERPMAAWEIWDVFIRECRPPACPEREEVASAVEQLRALGPILRAGESEAFGVHLPQIRAALRSIREQLRLWHARLMRANS